MADINLAVSKDLMDKLSEYSEAAGYRSGEEFAVAILQREIEKLGGSDDNLKIEDRLRGLGYIS